jgi:hypothetical protein
MRPGALRKKAGLAIKKEHPRSGASSIRSARHSLGTAFHVWRRLCFHNAIWHGFVLLAASCPLFGSRRLLALGTSGLFSVLTLGTDWIATAPTGDDTAPG